MPGIEIKGRSKIANYRHGGRAGFAHGSIAKIAARKFKKKKVYPETEDLTHQVGPYVGDVGSERKSTKRITKKPKYITRKEEPKAWIIKKDFKGKGSDKIRSLLKGKKTHGKDVPTMAAEGGRIGLKKGTDKKWIQKAVDPKHKGYCTPMTKKTCTPARKALARTFKKKAKTGWG